MLQDSPGSTQVVLSQLASLDYFVRFQRSVLIYQSLHACKVFLRIVMLCHIEAPLAAKLLLAFVMSNSDCFVQGNVQKDICADKR